MYDVASGGFERGLVGTSAAPLPTPLDKKREEPISGSIGTSVVGAASDSIGEFSVSETRIEKIAVTTSLVAVAVPGGALELWDAKTGTIRTAIAAPKHGTREYMTPKIDLMQFSPDGRWLVYYIEGIFNIVDVSEFSEPSTGSQEK